SRGANAGRGGEELIVRQIPIRVRLRAGGRVAAQFGDGVLAGELIAGFTDAAAGNLGLVAGNDVQLVIELCQVQRAGATGRRAGRDTAGEVITSGKDRDGNRIRLVGGHAQTLVEIDFMPRDVLGLVFADRVFAGALVTDVVGGRRAVI